MAEEARAIWMDDPQVIYDLDAFRDIWNDAINSGLMIPEDATPADFVDRGIDVPLLAIVLRRKKVLMNFLMN